MYPPLPDHSFSIPISHPDVTCFRAIHSLCFVPSDTSTLCHKYSTGRLRHNNASALFFSQMHVTSLSSGRPRYGRLLRTASSSSLSSLRLCSSFVTLTSSLSPACQRSPRWECWQSVLVAFSHRPLRYLHSLGCSLAAIDLPA